MPKQQCCCLHLIGLLCPDNDQSVRLLSACSADQPAANSSSGTKILIQQHATRPVDNDLAAVIVFFIDIARCVPPELGPEQWCLSALATGITSVLQCTEDARTAVQVKRTQAVENAGCVELCLSERPSCYWICQAWQAARRIVPQ
jgi:hypothetical protein